MDFKILFDNLRDLFQPAVGDPGNKVMFAERGVRAIVALRSGYSLVTVPEKRADRPNRTHTFEDVESFTSFLLKGEHGFTPQATEILGSSSDGCGEIDAVNTLAWERDEVDLKLPLSSAWSFWSTKKNGARVSLKELRELLRARRGDLAPSSKSILPDLTAVAVNISKNAKLEIDPKSGLITFDGVEKNTKVEGAIPSEIVLHLPIYEGGPVHEVTVDLVAAIDEQNSNALSFTLRLVDPDTVVREAWLEQIEKVRELLGKEWLVGIGTLGFSKE